MIMKKASILLFVISVLLIGCKKKGCTDPNATNFDISAKQDDGSCIFPPKTYSIETIPITANMGNSAESGGVINSDNNDVTIRGVCWSTNPYPTILDDTTINGSGTGTFLSQLTNLDTLTTYYVRAYANINGTRYGNQISFTTNSITINVFGDYLVSHDCQIDLGGFAQYDLLSDNQSIIAGPTQNEFVIDGFNAFVNQVPGTINGTTVTIPSVTNTISTGIFDFDVTIFGSGTINATSTEMVINYTYDDGLGGGGTCIATYTKQ
jgi:hypothetical protein